MNPKVENLLRHAGIAGQFSVTADVTYPDEPTRQIAFIGSTYGAPVVMRTDAAEVFVDRAVVERCGDFACDPEGFVRRFFGLES